MDDNALMKMSLSITLFGLLMLFFISKNIDYESDINTANAGSKINLKGKVVSIEHRNNTEIIEMLLYSRTRIVVFGRSDIAANDSIEVFGRVDEYDGKKEVIAENIRKI